MNASPTFADLAAQLKACRISRDAPRYGGALPHEPRPIIQGSATARLCIASQAPGTRAHTAGEFFPGPPGGRLRGWLGLAEANFYDERRVAIVSLGSCFSGHDATRNDLLPRR